MTGHRAGRTVIGLLAGAVGRCDSDGAGSGPGDPRDRAGDAPPGPGGRPGSAHAGRRYGRPWSGLRWRSPLAIAAQAAGWGEPIAGGRPDAGRLTYLSTLAALAGLGSVLNARAPGGRVWAGLMAVLVLVFLIPWLEGPWRMRRAGGLTLLHLDAPWTIFYWLLVVVGVTNYLPTRFGAAAGWLAVGFLLEYLGLTRDDWPASRRAILWSWCSWTLAAAAWSAHSRGRQRPRGPDEPGTALVLVPRLLGRRLGAAHPRAVQPHGRAEGLARPPGLVRPRAGRSGA